MIPLLKSALLLFLLFFLAPIGASAILYRVDGSGTGWRTADRSSAGLLPPPAAHPEAVVRVFAAQTVRWRGVFAVHCWIVFKPEGALGYTRYDYTAWGEPIRMNGFEPDGRWFGRVPEVVFAADGPTAAALIPRMEAAILGYAWRNRGDYRPWPGPIPTPSSPRCWMRRRRCGGAAANCDRQGLPYDGRWLRLTPSGTGVRLTLGGYAGVSLGWVEGIEVNILGAVAGLDLRRPALKLPGLGRIGMAGPDGPGTLAAARD
ncbi:DUF3750 domain-containing protein [Siccirubricoccus deserti]